MNVYKAVKTTEDQIRTGKAWDGADIAEIDQYMWGDAYRPVANASMLWTDEAFHIRFEVEESKNMLRSTLIGIVPDACTDSCVECFINPYPDEGDRYTNLEFSLSGALYCGLGTNRYDNRLLKGEDIGIFNIVTSQRPAGRGDMAIWGVTAKVPYDYIRRCFGRADFRPGSVLRANFFKCGDLCPTPHYGAWSRVSGDTIDFHQPGSFGSIVLAG